MNSLSTAINERITPYAIKFYLFLFIVSVIALGVRLVTLILAYLAILLGRWLLGRKNL